MTGDPIVLSFARRDVVEQLATRVWPRTLRPAVDAALLGSANVAIGGDLLQVAASCPALHGAVDLVVADPPWSGRDFFYDRRWETDPDDLRPGTEAGAGEEADWVRWLLPRLQVLQGMLTPAGVFVSTIDHRDLFLYGQLVDEVFGAENRITVIGWEKAYSYGDRVGTTWDYVIVVARSAEEWRTRFGGDAVWDPPQWWPASGQGSLGEAPLTATRRYTTHGTAELDRLLGADRRTRFPAAKPSSLYRALIEQWSDADALVLDPFAGSGACGQAVLDGNAATGARRRFVLVDQGNVISRLTLPRLAAAHEDASIVRVDVGPIAP